MPYYYSWTKESRTLKKKLSGLTKEEIIDKYITRDVLTKNPAKRASIYLECKYGPSKDIQDLALSYPQYQLGFFWIMRIHSGFQFNYKFLLKGKSSLENFPTCCPCCGEKTQSFSHWIFNCKAFEQDRNTFIKHNVDLNSKFTQINRTNSLGFSEDLDEDFENNIYYLMLNAFLDGCYAFDKLDIKRERRWWRGQLFKGSPESPVPYIVGLSHFLTVVIPIVNISFRILLNWYNNNKNTPGGFKGVDVEKIRHGIYSDTDSNGISFVEWERLEV